MWQALSLSRSFGVVLLNLKPPAGLAQGLEGSVHWGCGPVLLRGEFCKEGRGEQTQGVKTQF